MKPKAVVLVSGGLDSATVLAMVKHKGYDIYAISFNYAQLHVIELEKAQTLAKTYEVIEHKIVNIMDLGSMGGSSLTDAALEIPKYSQLSDISAEIPNTYVPARNTIFLSYALAFAEIKQSYDIFIGVHAQDAANYPDCSAEFIKRFEALANIATAIGSTNKIKIHAPLIEMNKAQIIKFGLSLAVDYSNTISCYAPTKEGLSCGICHACFVRLNGFKENNFLDPAYYSQFSHT